jgi:hypothetical protein
MNPVTITRFEGPRGGCGAPVFPAPRAGQAPACSRLAFYTVAYTTSTGGGGANVCAEHLFPTIGYFLGLPEAASR